MEAREEGGSTGLSSAAGDRAEVAGPPGSRGATLLLVVLAAGAAALARVCGRPGAPGVEVFAPLLLAPALLPVRLAAGQAAAGVAALALVPAAMALLGLAPGLPPGRYALVAVPCWAAAAILLARVSRLRGKLRVLRADMHRLAATDPLTGVSTRRELVQRGQQLFSLARRSKRPLAVLALDVDGLRRINDRFGQEMGDEVLRTVAARLREALRTTDVVGRVGGEEFAVVMPDTEIAGARVAAERSRGAVADDGLFAPGTREEIRFTVSIGVAPLGADDGDLEALLRRAQAALDDAKRAGRDRVAAAG
jgi:diguanylate cyclase (GGDEF)-like protein